MLKPYTHALQHATLAVGVRVAPQEKTKQQLGSGVWYLVQGSGFRMPAIKAHCAHMRWETTPTLMKEQLCTLNNLRPGKISNQQRCSFISDLPDAGLGQSRPCGKLRLLSMILRFLCVLNCRIRSSGTTG